MAQPLAEQVAATLDWGTTPLGPRDSWPAGLGAVVATMLASPLPMALVVGQDLTLLYNDAYAEIITSKHPDAFGRPAAEVFAENWDQPGHGDVVAIVMQTGQAFTEPETVVPVERHGRLEDVHFSRAYTAVRGDDGDILGVLTVIAESTSASLALSGIAELATRLTSALTVDDVARETLRYSTEVVGADHARISVASRGGLLMARRARSDSGDESFERLPPVWSSLPAGTRLPSAEVVRSGTPLWLERPTLTTFTDLRYEPLPGDGLAVVAAVPLHTDGVEGALSLGWEKPWPLAEAVRSALVTVGRLVGQALARARRFDEQRGVAEALQRSMLPSDLPHVPGISIAARYIPSRPGTSAGGDFYDAFPLPDGRLALAIGDVVGHGVVAATMMGQVRAALHVLTLRDGDPAASLDDLDALVASLGPEIFVTALVAVLDVVSGAVTLASAGHPAPVVRRADGRSEFLAVTPGTPVGIPDRRANTTATMSPGDVLVLFTDGLVEIPGQDPSVGLQTLRSALEEANDVAEPRRLCALLLDAMGSNGDDIALLAVSCETSPHRTSALELPAESTAPGTARRWARGSLVAWGVDDDVVDAAVLGVSELVTNALLHARTGARVELDLDDERLLVLVSDAGVGSHLAAQAADSTAVRGRGLNVIATVSDAWGSERNSRGTTVWFEVSRAPLTVTTN